MLRDETKKRGAGLYVLMAGGCILLLSLFVSISIALDIRRERERFAENTYLIHGYLESLVSRNLIALHGFAGLLQVEDVNDRDEITTYARFMRENHPYIYMLEVAQKVSAAALPAFVEDRKRSGLTDFTPKALVHEGVREWLPVEPKSNYYLVVFMEPLLPESRELLGLDLGSSPILKDALHRAMGSETAVASRPFPLIEGEMGYLLLRQVQRGSDHLLAIIVCKAPSLLPSQLPDAGNISLGVFYQDQVDHQSTDTWLIQRDAAPRGQLAQLLFPKFSVTRAFGGKEQPFMLKLEKQLDWQIISWDMIALIMLGGVLVLPLLLAYARIHHNNEMKRLEEGNKLFYLANFDALTGLPNRQLFINRLEQALAVASRQGLMHAVLFLDLDNFKDINDYYGHQIGDKVLQRAARIFQRSVREIDSVARLGGDEFVILLQDIDGRISAEHIANKIKQAFRESPGEGGKSIPVIGTSIGIAIYPEDGESAEALLNCADIHMYQDKVTRKYQRESTGPEEIPRRYHTQL